MSSCLISYGMHISNQIFLIDPSQLSLLQMRMQSQPIYLQAHILHGISVARWLRWLIILYD